MHEIALRRRLRVVAPDRPGIGGSDHHEGRGLVDWPPLVADLALQLGLYKFHALGVSGGGLYSLALARAMPDRLLSASVVCGAPSFHELGGIDRLPLRYRLMHLIYSRFPWLMRLPFEIGWRIAGQGPDDFPLSLMLKKMLGPRDQFAMLECGELPVITQSFRDGWTGYVHGFLTDAEVYLNPLGFNLAEIHFPVHCWHGTDDRNIPFEFGQKMSDRLPNATRHWVEGEGHFSLPVLRMEEILDAAGA